MEPQEVNNYVTPVEKCVTNVTDNLIGHLYCNATWDTITCWPPTMAETVATRPCPYIFGAVENSFVYKTCGQDGKWIKPEMWSGFGYSDYSECIAHLSMIEEVFEIEGLEEQEETETILRLSLQPVMIVGVTLLAMSLLSLLIALIAMKYALPLSLNQANQCKITSNLFCAVLFEAIFNMIQTVLIISEVQHGFDLKSVADSAVICTILLTAVEFSGCAICMWLFLQAYHLRLVTLSGQLCTSKMLTYCLIGWGIPAIPSAIWAVAVSLSDNRFTCWAGYKYLPTIWILESSKIVMMFAACACLLKSLKQMLHKSINIKRLSRCSRRIRFENGRCTCYFLFITLVLTLVLINNHVYQEPYMHGTNMNGHGHSYLSRACMVLVASKGVIMSCIFLTINVDTRKCLQKQIGKIHHQPLGLVSVHGDTPAPVCD